MASVGPCPHLLTLSHTVLPEGVASRPPLLLLLPACPLAAELPQLLVQPPLQLGPLGRVQGPVLGPTACVQHSFPANPLASMGTSLFSTAVDLKEHKSQGELWAREAAAHRTASKGPPKAVQDHRPALLPSPGLFHSCPGRDLQDGQTSSTLSSHCCGCPSAKVYSTSLGPSVHMRS